MANFVRSGFASDPRNIMRHVQFVVLFCSSGKFQSLERLGISGPELSKMLRLEYKFS